MLKLLVSHMVVLLALFFLGFLLQDFTLSDPLLLLFLLPFLGLCLFSK